MNYYTLKNSKAIQKKKKIITKKNVLMIFSIKLKITINKLKFLKIKIHIRVK